MKRLILSAVILLIAVSCANAAVKAGSTAHYFISGAGEGQASSVAEAWVIADAPEKVNGRPYQWWRLVMKKQDGSILAVKALSESVPMASPNAPGDIARYIYSPKPGTALEYVDLSTNRALLPELDFKRNFLPQAAPDAGYSTGFAYTGTLLGQVMTKTPQTTGYPRADFSKTRVLRIRTDFIIGTSRTVKDNGVMPEKPGFGWTFVDWTPDDIRKMIDAGFNYFSAVPTYRPYIEDEAVFIAGTPTFPDDLYRSNFLTSSMFIDEPMVRLGWSGGVPGFPSGPEVVAQALRLRVEEQQLLRKRVLKTANDAELGTLDLFKPKAPSWETEYWSAWYQLQAGAPGIVHEGRYVNRGYGWEPESLFGEGLDGLTKTDQFNFIYAFLRGAARSFNGDWGTSLYGHSDLQLRAPAFIRAYNMGAKYLWFWTSDHEHHMPFTEQLRLAKAISDYADAHPRNREKLVRNAEVGIALPPGYAFNWNGAWGMEREQMNPSGVSYGDISAAAAWEGIVCSRKGVEFDFLVDHPGIEKLGYKRLVRVQEDGTLKVTPSQTEKRAPQPLSVRMYRQKQKLISGRMNAKPEFEITRAGKVRIDGSFDDWSDAKWIKLDGSKWFGDSVEIETKLTVPESGYDYKPGSYLGITYTPLNEELLEKYSLEALPHEDLLVITSIEPGSPAEKAGLKEGDIILDMAGRKVKYDMHFHQIYQDYRNKPGKEINVKIRRSGRSRYAGADDLSAETAFMLDDKNLYFAAKVKDDTHIQNKRGWELWMHDSIQIGFDPILDRTKDNYGENDHEIGLALKNGKPVVWRWKGRRGQPIGDMKMVEARVLRKNGETLYEAAIPLSELKPFAPDMWPKCGIDIVINDNDEENVRKGRLELASGAMTRGKHPDQFAVFECSPSPNPYKVSAGLVWNKRAMPVGGGAELTMALRSDQTRVANLKAEFISLDNPETRPAVSELRLPVTSEPGQYTLKVSSKSPAGRYKLKLGITDRMGHTAAEDSLNVYIYP